MKGVVLAGGTGSRLHPLTRVTNKHLLPVYDKPMIYYPVQTLVDAGIRDILIVTGGNNAGDFVRLMRNGRDFGLEHLNFAYQEGSGGIADALRLARSFVGNDSLCVILGDNILEGSIRAAREQFDQQEDGALILLKEVGDPQRFGVPEFAGGRIVGIEEKPKAPKSSYAVIGVYFYDATVFDRIGRLAPSDRNEYEITDVNNSYLKDGKLRHAMIDGWWTDAGTFESLWRASELSRQKALAAGDGTAKPDDRRASGTARGIHAVGVPGAEAVTEAGEEE